MLAAASQAFSGEIAGKALWLGILWIAGIAAYGALPSDRFAPRAAAAGIYVFNPFVYGRLHYGQVFLLAGYAVLPWVAANFRRLGQRPGLRSALAAGFGLVLIGAFTAHLFLLATFRGVVVLLMTLAIAEDRASALGSSWRWWGVAALVAAIGSAYWWIPVVAGTGSESNVIATTGSGALHAYAAVTDTSVGLLPNILGLYGFWAENSGRFTSMKAFVPSWPVALGLLISVCGLGALKAIRKRREGLAPWAIALVAAGAMSVVLESGISSTLTGWLVDWLDAHFAVYRGMRDSAKWGALLALVYSQLFGLGVAAIHDGIRRWELPPAPREWIGSVAVGILLALPLYYGNGLLFGMHGEIKPSYYPAGWYAADRLLASDPNPGRMLLLPWHEYMRYSFVRNENNVVASPAPLFFSIPVVVSGDPEVQGISPPKSHEQNSVSNLIAAGASGDWTGELRLLGIKYVGVIHELDWQSYGYLDRQPGFIKVADFGTMTLYRSNRY
jgi:hypothetical protein